MKWLLFACRNVLRNRRRSLMALAITAVGTAAALLGGGFALFTYDSLREVSARETGHVVLGARDFFEGDEDLPMQNGLAGAAALDERLRALPGVRAVLPRIQFSGLVSNGDKSAIFIGAGVVPELDFRVRGPQMKFIEGEPFGPGSAVLTPKAKEVVTKLSKILKDENVKGFELMIAGHTDAQPVEHAATVKAGHPDNWFLSAHRAISVGKCLQSCQVGANRMAMVGFADQRPVASNETSGGRAKNRRVELLILPTKAQEVSADWLNYGKKSSKSQGRKDATAGTDASPSFNK